MDLLMRIKLALKEMFNKIFSTITSNLFSKLLLLAKDKCGRGGHGGAHQEKKSEKRKTHDVDPKHQAILDDILENVFDRNDYIETTEKYAAAYGNAVKSITDKKFHTVKDAEEALTDALIKYRKEAGIPVSDDPQHRHIVYNELHSLLYEQLAKEQGMGGVEGVRKKLLSGKAYELFDIIHRNELNTTLTGRVKYKLHQTIGDDLEPDDYQGIMKAHGNYTGQFYSRGKLAELGNKAAVVRNIASLYVPEMERQVTDVAKERKKAAEEAPHEGAHHGH